MRKIQRTLGTLSVLALAITLSASGPVFAKGTGDTIPEATPSGTSTPATPEHQTSTSGSTTNEQRSGGSTTAGSSSVHGSDATSVTSTEGETKTSAEDNTSHSELHTKGEGLVAELRKKHPKAAKKTDAERHKQCVAHKQGLTTKFSKMVRNSQAAQDRITNILDKAVAYQKSSNVAADNFDTDVAAAQAAQAASAGSIRDLQSVTPTLDCNSTSVANDVATFKSAAETTRTNLKTYRSSVKSVLQVLETAKTSTGGAQQ